MRVALTLGVGDYALSYCGKGNIESAHSEYHIVGQGVQRKGLYDELEVEHCVRSRSYCHNLGRYNYPFQALHSRRLGIQGFENPSALRLINLPSNSDVTHLCRELDLLCLLQQTWQSLRELGVCLSVYLLRMQKSWLASLGNKGYQLMLASPFGWLKSLPLLRVAKQDYQSYFLKLNQVVFSYLIIPQTGVGCKP